MLTFFNYLLAISAIISASQATNWNCSKTEAIEAFKQKSLLNQYQSFENDPYKNQTDASYARINNILLDKEMVCAIQYKDEAKRTYTIRTFASAKLATENGHIVTHQGPCGACSNTNDLSVYLSTDLTAPARR